MRVRTRSVGAGDHPRVTETTAIGPRRGAAPETRPITLERHCWLTAIDLVHWDGAEALPFARAKALLFGRAGAAAEARLWAWVARAVEAILEPRGDRPGH